jgi:hypothetical protein
MSGAATIDGAAFPPTVTVEGRIPQLNGVGLRTLTLHRIHACLAALYREHTSHDAAAIEASPDTKMLIPEYLGVASKEGAQDVFRQRAALVCGAGGYPASDAQDFERLVEDEQFLRESESQAASGRDRKPAARSPTPGSHRDQWESGWQSSTGETDK